MAELKNPAVSGVFRALLATKGDVGDEEEETGCVAALKMKYAEWRARTPDLNVVWRDSFKAIDGFFGSATAVSFVYTRWIFLHNLGIFVLWLGLVMVRFFRLLFASFPYLRIQVPSIITFGWSTLTPSYRFIWAEGLEETPFFYGGYYTSAGFWPQVRYCYLLDVVPHASTGFSLCASRWFCCVHYRVRFAGWRGACAAGCGRRHTAAA